MMHPASPIQNLDVATYRRVMNVNVEANYRKGPSETTLKSEDIKDL